LPSPELRKNTTELFRAGSTFPDKPSLVDAKHAAATARDGAITRASTHNVFSRPANHCSSPAIFARQLFALRLGVRASVKYKTDLLSRSRKVFLSPDASLKAQFVYVIV
jgi:hypothetical protein